MEGNLANFSDLNSGACEKRLKKIEALLVVDPSDGCTRHIAAVASAGWASAIVLIEGALAVHLPKLDSA